MKKDFSQPFEATRPYISVIVQDAINGKFALKKADNDEWSEGFDEIFGFKADDGQLALQLVKYLHGLNFDIVEFRELNRETRVSYSFIDDTPGSLSESICIHALVRALDAPDMKSPNGSMEWLDLKEFVPKMENSHSLNRNIDIGLMKLYFEPETLSPETGAILG